MDKFINVVEDSLLHDLLALYSCDLESDVHMPAHGQCLSCSKQALIIAITKYQELDAFYRRQASLVATESLCVTASPCPAEVL